MKKIILMLLVVGIGVFIGSCNEKKAINITDSNVDTAGSPKALVVDNTLSTLISIETPLHFGLLKDPGNYYTFNKEDIDLGENKFYSNYKYDNGINSSGIPDTTRLDSCYTLVRLDTLSAIIKDLKIAGYPISDKYYTAVRMHYGMEGKKLILIFEPIVLKPSSNESPNKNCKIISPCKNRLYKFDEFGNAKIINSNEFQKFIDEYRSSSSKIYINHFNKIKKTKFYEAKPDNLKESDVKSAVMSVQQILRVFKDNSGNFNLGREKIKFSFVSQNYNGSEDGKPHIIATYNFGVLSEKSLSNKEEEEANFIGLGGDFSQLCPDQCNEISINKYINDY
jgi:hypothetical protein